MQILLTGAAGFIGTHLAGRLLSEGHSVLGVDNFITGQRDNRAHLDVHPRFSFIEHDVAEPLSLPGSVDWILHFASPASPPRYLAHPDETMRVNSEGTRHLLDLATQKGARFFLASTSEVYGDPRVHPQKEDYWGHVNPVGPRSVYDEAKRYAETITTSYHRSRGLPIRVIRIFNTYGPKMDPSDGRVVSNLICQALTGQPLTIYGDGNQSRSFQYVDDLVDGILKLLSVDYSHPVNLGNPDEYTILELAQLINELTGAHSPIVHAPLPTDDPRQRRPDISLAKELLDWEPQVDIRDGLRQTIGYFSKVPPQSLLAR